MCPLQKCLFAAILIVSVSAIELSAEIKGYSATSPGTIVDVEPASGSHAVPPEFAGCPAAPNPPNTLFSGGFTSGLAFVDDTLFGLFFDPGGSPNVFLFTLTDTFCATAQPVAGASALPNLESLTYIAQRGLLYSVDFSFGGHVGRLVTIDPDSGSTTIIGAAMARDVWVVGLAFDPTRNTLFGVTNGFADRNVQELYRIDLDSGVETLIGATGTAPHELKSLTLDSSTTPPRLIAAGTTLYEINRDSGVATPIGGSFPAPIAALADRSLPQLNCFGDCNSDASVTVDEILTLVNIALGGSSLSTCSAGDSNGDFMITVDEILTAINNALEGC